MTLTSQKPIPLFDQRKRPKCPVCGNTSYSSDGIHPQCSARAADAERMKPFKEDATNAPPISKTPAPHQKSCPRCKAIQHVRKKNCGCGHQFVVDRRPPQK